MTVCIGAICETSSVIVTASDRSLTWATSQSETALKAARLAPGWMTMIAGDDITRGVEDVIRTARSTLSAYDDEGIDVPQVQGALLGAWRDVGNQIATAMVLSPFTLTVQEFVRTGRERFGDAKFSELVEQIRLESKIHSQVLLCGFDQKKIPHLLACDDETPCADFTRADYAAIGSGAHAALSSLGFHGYTREIGLADAVYQVCTAKFMAERSPGVGKETLVLCLRDDAKTKWIFKGHIKQIRELWERDGRPRMPEQSRITQTLDPILEHQEWLD